MAQKNHPKTRQVVAQVVGRSAVSAIDKAREAAREAAEEGLRRMAAREKALRDVARLRTAGVNAYNNAVAWQNQRLDVIRTKGNQRVQKITSGAERRLRNVQENATRAARNQTARMEQAVQRRAADARAVGQRAHDARMAASRNGVWRNATDPALPQKPSLNPVRAAEVAERRAGIAQRRALNDLKRLRTQTSAREAASVRRTVDSTARAIETRANRVVRSTRAAEQNVIRHTRAATQQIQQRFNAAATRVMQKAGPKATFLQGAMAKAAQLGQTIPKAPGLAAGKAGAFAGKLAPKVSTLGGLLAPRAEVAKRVAALGGSKAKVAKAAFKTAELAVTAPLKAVKTTVETAAKTAAAVARFPAKAVAGGFKAVETAGGLVAGAGKMGNIVRGLTNASGLAGGLATGAWIDAGLNYAEFKAQGHSLSDLGKTIGTIQVDGHTVELKNPTLGDAVWSSKYAGEVARGALRNLTFGIFGGEEYEWENGGGVDSNEFNRRIREGLDPLTGEPLRDTDGADVSGAIAAQTHQLDAVAQREKAIASYFMSFDPSNKGKVDAARAAQGAKILGFANPASGDVAGFVSAIRALGEQKDQKIDGLRQRLSDGAAPVVEDYIARHMQNGATREQAIERYIDTATKNITKEYDKRVDMMMKSDVAAKASDYNRRQAYLVLTGRDYDVDTRTDLADDAKAQYAEFNQVWGDTDIRDRVMFDRDAFAKDLAADTEAAYQDLTATDPKDEETTDV